MEWPHLVGVLLGSPLTTCVGGEFGHAGVGGGAAHILAQPLTHFVVEIRPLLSSESCDPK